MKDELLPSWNIDHHPKVFLAMTGQKSGQNIARLQPDIVGEHFALACLKNEDLSDEDRARLCELAWRFYHRGMAAFILRSHLDLPADPMLKWVRKSPASEGELQLFWSLVARDLMFHLRSHDPEAAAALLSDMRGVAASAHEYWDLIKFKMPAAGTLWNFWAEAAAASIGCDLASLLQNSALADPPGIKKDSFTRTRS